MNVAQLIKELEKCDKDKIVVLTEPDGKGWDNVGAVIEEKSTVSIIMDGNGLFQAS
jgi:hypothetical protein